MSSSLVNTPHARAHTHTTPSRSLFLGNGRQSNRALLLQELNGRMIVGKVALRPPQGRGAQPLVRPLIHIYTLGHQVLEDLGLAATGGLVNRFPTVCIRHVQDGGILTRFLDERLQVAIGRYRVSGCGAAVE